MSSKLIFFIRHGGAFHNVLYKKIGMNALLSSDVIDSPLTDAGYNQAHICRSSFKDDVDLVLVSPLRRALETADIIFKNKAPIICQEFLREYPIGKQTCNKRYDIAKMIDMFPEINFSDIKTNRDIFWTHTPETIEAFDKRIFLSKEYIYKRPEVKIAIVGHRSYIGKFKDNKIHNIDNGEHEIKHGYPYPYYLSPHKKGKQYNIHPNGHIIKSKI